MKRRAFIAALGGAAAVPFAASAQQPTPTIGFVRSATLADVPQFVTAFRAGLKEMGFVEGQNVAVEYRAAENDPNRLKAVLTELLRRPVSLLVGNNDAMIMAKAMTTTVPIVFAAGSDPVRDGLVQSLNRPGGNITGALFLAGSLGAKRLEVLRQVVPRATTIGFLVNPNTPVSEGERYEVEPAAESIGQKLLTVDVNTAADIEAAFTTFVERGVSAVLVGAGPFLNSSRRKIAELAARHAIPAIYAQREGADSGGLMSYGTNISEAYRQVGIYAGRILKGEKPGDLPVIQAAKFEFVINLKTAKALGLEFHPQLLATADEVIE
jgi:putative ABC transport system substrate-binding protein